MKAPRLRKRRARIEKGISTWLSQLALGVKTDRQRGWSSSESLTSCVVRVKRLSLIAITSLPVGISASSWSRKRSRSKRLRVFGGYRAHLARVHPRRREQVLSAVASVLVLAPRRAGLPGATCMSCRVGALAWMPVFSSTETVRFSAGVVLDFAVLEARTRVWNASAGNTRDRSSTRGPISAAEVHFATIDSNSARSDFDNLRGLEHCTMPSTAAYRFLRQQLTCSIDAGYVFTLYMLGCFAFSRDRGSL